MNRPMPCEVITWNRFHAMARHLAREIRASGFRPDTIVAVGRGGYMPARILSDFLGVFDLTSFKIEHYLGPHKGKQAVVRYPLAADLAGRRVLLVDDVTDSGDTFDVALAHLMEQGPPGEVRTVVLHHKAVSRFEPDYYAHKVVKWRWIIYPWAVAEDLTSFIKAMEPQPTAIDEVATRLAAEHGIRISSTVLRDVLAMLDNG